MKVWITKYALTKGIIVDYAQEVGGGVIKTQHSHYYHAREWCRDEATALIDAEQKRIAKIKSLEKSLKKLQEMKFKIRGPIEF